MATLVNDIGEAHLFKTEVDELVGEKIWDRSRAVLALVSLLLELGHLASTLAMLTFDNSLCTCGTFYELGRSQMQFKTSIQSPSLQENKSVTFLLEFSVAVDFFLNLLNHNMVEQGCRVSTENRADHLVSQPTSLFL